MGEIVPIALGILVGLVVMRVTSVQRRTAAFAGLSVLGGVAATFITGEALISWAFVLIDIPLVALAAMGTVLAPRVVERVTSTR